MGQPETPSTAAATGKAYHLHSRSQVSSLFKPSGSVTMPTDTKPVQETTSVDPEQTFLVYEGHSKIVQYYTLHNYNVTVEVARREFYHAEWPLATLSRT
jgi:hypothetical protein